MPDFLRRRKTCLALLAVVLLAACVAGCAPPEAHPGDDPDTGDSDTGQDQEVTLVLYFPDDQAMYLEREERTVEAAEGETYETLAVRALIEGPAVEGHGVSIPEGTELLSLEVTDGVAYVNFSEEFVTNHWGGSTGEIMTIYSVVNTLTESPDVTAVVFLVEGEKLGTLAGHIELTDPVERNEDIIAGEG
jgi:germination protein M